jgi:hypothetical protein
MEYEREAYSDEEMEKKEEKREIHSDSEDMVVKPSRREIKEEQLEMVKVTRVMKKL